MSGARSVMGPRVGDTLELRDEQSPFYVVTGDLADTRATSKGFDTITAAIAYAWDSLTLYQEGRTS